VTATVPTQALCARLPAPPEAVWARVGHSGFIAGYLGAQLPAAVLQAGAQLAGSDRDGQPLLLTVTEALPPCGLSLRLQTAGQVRLLRLSISACAPGSRLTVLHEAVADAALPADPGDLAQRLARPPAAALLAGPITDAGALAAARVYLADTAGLVDALRRAMAPGEGYGLPAGGGFSLVQHLWHLADIEDFGWTPRFSRLLCETAPVLPGVDGDRLAVERRYQQRPWRAAARRFVARRRRTLAALAHCDAATLRRPVHFSGQPGTGADLLAALLAHDHEHRAEMAMLWPPSPHPALEGAPR